MLEAKWDTFYLIFTSVYEHTPDLFRQTKRLTKMISSDEPMGFHITVPYKGIVFITFTLIDTFYLIFMSVCEHTPPVLSDETANLLILSDKATGFHITAPLTS